MQTPVQVLYSDSRYHKHQNLASSPTEVGRVALGGPKSIKCLRGSVKKYSLTSAAPLSGTTGAPPPLPPSDPGLRGTLHKCTFIFPSPVSLRLTDTGREIQFQTRQ